MEVQGESLSKIRDQGPRVPATGIPPLPSHSGFVTYQIKIKINKLMLKVQRGHYYDEHWLAYAEQQSLRKYYHDVPVDV